MKLNTINIVHEWIKLYIKEGAQCIDATAGRGYDTAFLCEQVGTSGNVIAFDIQEEAILSTKALLEEKGLSSRATLHLDTHSHMAHYAEAQSTDAIMFNFGYLPGADHHIATRADTSIEAIRQGLELLKQGGIMTLCIYHGGDTGFEEKDEIMSCLKEIDAKKYTVVVSELYNKPNYPPLAVCIRRDRK